MKNTSIMPSPPPSSPFRKRLQSPPMDALARKAIAAGLLLAMLVLAFGPVAFLLSPLITVVHELGHTCLSWLFGYPAIPAFDFINGGGVTLHSTERIDLILLLIYAAFGYLFYRYWNNHLTARVLSGIVLGYTLCAFTPLHGLLILSMGHGFELLFAGLFLYRGVSGVACRSAIERPLYTMLSFYLTAYDIRLTYGLLFNAEVRDLYLQGKGGVLDNDLVRVAQDYLQVHLSVVAALLLIAALLTPVATMVLYANRFYFYQLSYRLWVLRQS